MHLQTLDWLIISIYIAFALGVGIFFSRRAGESLSEFFISGRKLPWWIAGTSMVATTFAADTPLFVSGVIAREGIAGNWLWWNLAATHVMATLFFARLWHRSGIMTDLELLDLRYSGKPARILRGFRSLWEGIVLNCIVMGWVMLAMIKIVGVFVDWPTWNVVTLLLVIALTYSVLSGFWGVVMTDVVQFVIAMFAAIMLAVIVVSDNGGMENIKVRLFEMYADKTDHILSFVPQVGSGFLPVTTFVAFISVNWWATKSADGGSYLAQRMFATKDERHSFLATLWFTVAHYCLRPWPWIVVGLAALVVYPNLPDPELAYPMMVVKYLPSGLLGLMLVSFLAAFMSTIDTQVNWGTSILVNDFYKAFANPGKHDRHYVMVSRLVTVLLLVLATITAMLMQSIKSGWELFYGMSAGIGGVYIARWFWWRVNAWSEIVAWISAACTYSVLYFMNKHHPTELYSVYGIRLMLVTGISTICWLTATFLTAPVAESRLIDFYKRVKPGSPFWKPIAQKVGQTGHAIGWHDLVAWLSGVVFIYAALFGIGKIVLGFYPEGLVYSLVGVAAAFVGYKAMASQTI